MPRAKTADQDTLRKKNVELTTELGKTISELGVMHVDDARRWLMENGAAGGKSMGNLFVSGPNRKLWYRDGDLLRPGIKPVNPPATPGPGTPQSNGHAPVGDTPGQVPVDTSTEEPAAQPLSDVRTEMVGAAVGIGIHPTWSNTMATFLVRSYDVYDPEEVWEGLMQVTEVPISQRRRFFRTWMSYVGASVPGPLEDRIKAIAPVYDDQKTAATPAKAKGRKFYAVDGEVLTCPVDAEEEMGVSWPVALQMAKQQVEKTRSLLPGPTPDGGGVVVELVRQMGENSRQQVEMMAGPGPDPEKAALAAQLQETRIENLRNELTGKMDLANLETRHNMDRMQDQLTSNLSELTKAVTGLAQASARPPASALDSLTELVKLKDSLASLFPPPLAPQPAFNFPMGPNGEMVPMSLDNMFRMQEFQDKRENGKFMREQVPNLLQIGGDILEAFRRGPGWVPGAAAAAADQPPAELPVAAERPAIPLGPPVLVPAVPPEGQIGSACVQCGMTLFYPPEAYGIVCPRCETGMLNEDGKLVPLPPGVTLVDRTEEPPEAEAPVPAARPADEVPATAPAPEAVPPAAQAPAPEAVRAPIPLPGAGPRVVIGSEPMEVLQEAVAA